MFFDRARIFVAGGDGGDGIVAFRREKHTPRGGPAGGNGGRGGHVLAEAHPELNTLLHLRRHVHFRAGKGGRGGGTVKQGAQGDDVIVALPQGTLIRNADDGSLLADLAAPDQRCCLARGGRGGKGNAAFRSARHQAPRLAENGESGESCWLELELKLVAEVGIIGVPNAGKSTLISRISAARPEIADYPFTTTVPNLGVAEIDHRQRVFVDVPGLVKGAHKGTGLGIEFLRHVERTRVLLHLLDGASEDPLTELHMVEQELHRYSPALLLRPRMVVLAKMDLPQAQAWKAEVAAHCARQALPFHAVSAVTGQQVQPLLYAVDSLLRELPHDTAAGTIAMPEIVPHEADRSFTIEPLGPGTWRVRSPSLERAAHMTNWDYFESAMRFQHLLTAWGIRDALQQQGVAEGDTVFMGELELIWGYDNVIA